MLTIGAALSRGGGLIAKAGKGEVRHFLQSIKIREVMGGGQTGKAGNYRKIPRREGKAEQLF